MLYYCGDCEFFFESKADKPPCRQCSRIAQRVEERQEPEEREGRPTQRFESFAAASADEPTGLAPVRKKDPENQ